MRSRRLVGGCQIFGSFRAVLYERGRSVSIRHLSWRLVMSIDDSTNIMLATFYLYLKIRLQVHLRLEGFEAALAWFSFLIFRSSWLLRPPRTSHESPRSEQELFARLTVGMVPKPFAEYLRVCLRFSMLAACLNMPVVRLA